MKVLNTGIVLLLAIAACDVIDDEPPDMQVLRESRPLGEIKPLTVDVNFDVGTMEIAKSMDQDLFSVDLEYDRRRATPNLDFTGSALKFDLDSKSIRLGGRGVGRNNLSLRLNEKVPLDLDIDTGVSEARMDLGGLTIRRLVLQAGVGKTEVTFDKPTAQPVTEMRVESGVGELIIRGLGNARLGQLTLEGGVGRTEIDFTGDLATARLEARIEVGVGQIKLLLPREADIEIQAEGSFLSNVSAPSFQRTGRNGGNQTFTHRSGAAGESPRIFIRIESGIGGVVVDLI
ncbi:MAG: hypothetical protein HY646_02250 [Acidobacteria bacterium]|nr:hypothetical protein [Acidobacteriota bacterium]